MRGVRRSRWLVMMGAASALVFATGIPTKSAAPQQVTRHLGPASVLNGQVATVSVSNLNDGPVRPRVAILDGLGEVVTQARPTIQPGATALVSGGVIDTTEFGDVLRARIISPRDHASGLPSALTILAGAGGDTVAAIGRSTPKLLKDADQNDSCLTGYGCVSSPLFHLGQGQSLRVLVTNLNASANEVIIESVDAAGFVVEMVYQRSLAAGATDSATISSDSPMDVRARIGVSDNTRVIATFEIFNEETGVVVAATAEPICEIGPPTCT